MREDLPFEAALGHPRRHDLGDAAELIADQSVDVLPGRVLRVGGGLRG